MARSGLRFVTLREFLAEVEEPMPSVVDECLYRGGTSMLIGCPKLGKSTLARSLVLAVSRGQSFLGRRTTACPVMLIAVEDSRPMLRKILRQAGFKPSKHVFIHTGPIENPNTITLEHLERHIRTTKVGLCVIDTLCRFLRFLDISDYTKVMEPLDKITGIAQRTSCHIMCLHHSRKARSPWAGDNTLGSQSITGTVDTVLYFDSRRRQLRSQQRYGTELTPTTIVRDPDTGLSRSSSPDADTGATNLGDKADHVATVLNLIATSRTPLTAQDIRNTVTMRKQDLLFSLQTLTACGAILRTGTGHKNNPFTFTLGTPDQPSSKPRPTTQRRKTK